MLSVVTQLVAIHVNVLMVTVAMEQAVKVPLYSPYYTECIIYIVTASTMLSYSRY